MVGSVGKSKRRPLLLRKFLQSTGIAIAIAVTGALNFSHGRLWLQDMNTRSQDDFYVPKFNSRRGIALNSNSTVASDVSSIYHNPNDHAVCVTMRGGARCPRPSLVGRLAGASLVMLEWEGNEATAEPTMCGYYGNSWIPPGRYFLEVLIIHCNDFGTNKPISYDFAYDCVEDPDNNRITSDDPSLSYVIIQNEIRGRGQTAMGHWTPRPREKWGVHLTPEEQFFPPSNSYNRSNETLPYLARYQPQGCRDEKNKKTVYSLAAPSSAAIDPRCQIPMKWYTPLEKEYAPYKRWEFKWNANASARIQDTLRRIQVERNDIKFYDVSKGGGTLKIPQLVKAQSSRLRNRREPRLCVVGASHALHLMFGFYMMGLAHKVVWADARYPREVTLQFLESHYKQYRCTKFLVGVGQWPAAYKEGAPYLFPRWKGENHDIFREGKVRQIQLTDGDREIRIYMRSIHYRPIGQWVGACNTDETAEPQLPKRPRAGPVEWTSPTVIRAYNDILDRMVSENNDDHVHYIDTTFITFPQWDAAFDWNHLPPEVSTPEAAYIASQIFD